MKPLEILILSDQRPGHYHLAEGVAAAIARRRPVSVRRLDITRRRGVPGRLLALGHRLGLPAGVLLRLGYGIARDALGQADLVISAGGDTLGANVAAAQLLGARAVFCGTLRHFPPAAFDLVISSYARHATLDRHLVALKPNGLDPDNLAASRQSLRRAPGAPPKIAGLLIGGDSGLFKYREDEWETLLGFLEECHRAFGTRWIVSTSRRSPDTVADALLAMTGNSDAIDEVIDFRRSGPGTLPRLLTGVDAALVTEDSSTMISEAVCARLPVIGVAPAVHDFKDEEREYRTFMTRKGWVRSIALANLTPATFLEALADIRPLEANHLDQLADALAQRLPELFTSSAP